MAFIPSPGLESLLWVTATDWEQFKYYPEMGKYLLIEEEKVVLIERSEIVFDLGFLKLQKVMNMFL